MCIVGNVEEVTWSARAWRSFEETYVDVHVESDWANRPEHQNAHFLRDFTVMLVFP